MIVTNFKFFQFILLLNWKGNYQMNYALLSIWTPTDFLFILYNDVRKKVANLNITTFNVEPWEKRSKLNKGMRQSYFIPIIKCSGATYFIVLS